jgi:hypothetical protein
MVLQFDIQPVRPEADLEAVRRLLEAYAASIGTDPGYHDSAAENDRSNHHAER